MSADGYTLNEHFMPAQTAIFAFAMPFDAQLLPGGRTCDQFDRVLLRIGTLASTELADVKDSELLAVVAEGGTGFGIDIDDGASFDVMYENRVLGGVENRPIVRLRYPQCL